MMRQRLWALVARIAPPEWLALVITGALAAATSWTAVDGVTVAPGPRLVIVLGDPVRLSLAAFVVLIFAAGVLYVAGLRVRQHALRRALQRRHTVGSRRQHS